jgi:hypothetical protein
VNESLNTSIGEFFSELAIFFHERGRKVASARFNVPRFYSKEGVLVMPAALALANDEMAVLPAMSFTDRVGADHSPPTDGVITSDHPEFATGTLDATGQIPTITAVADGVATFSYASASNPTLVTDTLVVTVGNPVPTAQTFNTAGATFTQHP